MQGCIRSLIVVLLVSVSALAQQMELVSLFDGRTLNNWTIDNEYSKNFSIQAAVLHVEGAGGWLRSTRQYSDFTLRLELRFLTEDLLLTRANNVLPSGYISMECATGKRGFPISRAEGG